MLKLWQKFYLAIVILGSILVLNFGLVSAACTPCDASTTAGAIQCGTNNAAGVPGTCQDAATTLNTTVKNAINLMSILVGALAVVMLIVGGFRYVSSAGKDESVKNAKNTILYALIGLVIVAVAQLMVHYVLDQTNTATNAGTSSTTTGSSGAGAGVGCGAKPLPPC